MAAPVRTSGSNQQPLCLGHASKDYRAGGGGLLCPEQGRGPKWCRRGHERTTLEGISVVWSWGVCGREESRQGWPEQRAAMCTQEGPLRGLWGAGCHVPAVGAMNRTSGVTIVLTDLSSHSQESGVRRKAGCLQAQALLAIKERSGFTLHDGQGALPCLEVMTLRRAALRTLVEPHIQNHLPSPSLLVLIIIVLSLLSCSTNYEMMRLDCNLHILGLK